MSEVPSPKQPRAKRRPARAKKDLPAGIAMHRAAGRDGQPDRWRYRVRLQWEGRQVSIGLFDTLTDAKAARDRAAGEIASRTFVPPSQRRAEARKKAEEERLQAVTVEQWSQQWLKRLQSGQTRNGKARSSGTITSYRSTLSAHVLPALGHVRLADVTREDVDGLLATVADQSGAWNNVLRTVRAMFGEAIRAEVGGVEVSPVRAPEKPVRLSEEGRTLEPEQVAALARAMPDGLGLTVLLAAWCALRQGEVLGLQRRDVKGLGKDGEAVLQVRRQWNSKTHPPTYTLPKEEKVRDVAIPPTLVPLLAEYLKGMRDKDGQAPLFRSPRWPKQPLSHQALTRAWDEARRQVVPGFRFHDLRGVGLSYFSESGATVEETMTRGGHSDVKAAMRYQHARMRRQQALAAALPVVV